MATYSFNEKAIASAVEAAQRSHQESQENSVANLQVNHGNCMLVGAECIDVTVENHKVCVNLPLGFGKHCFSIPTSIADGASGKACISLCTTWGVPTGVRITITILGVTVISQSFGKC